MVGTEETRLVVLRGNSASVSSVTAGLRELFGSGRPGQPPPHRATRAGLIHEMGAPEGQD
jgi:hypothetical protein